MVPSWASSRDASSTTDIASCRCEGKKSDRQTLKNEARYRRGLIGAARHAADRWNAAIVFVPMKPGSADQPAQDDAHFCRELAEEVDRPDYVRLLPPEVRPGEVKWCISRMQCLIGVRTHSTILALGACVPAINICYNGKGLSLFQAFGLEQFCLPIEDCGEQKLPPLLERMWYERDSLRKLIEQRLPQFQSRARIPYKALAKAGKR